MLDDTPMKGEKKLEFEIGKIKSRTQIFMNYLKKNINKLRQ